MHMGQISAWQRGITYNINCRTFMSHRSENLLTSLINTPDKISSSTPLHFASEYGDVEIVELLLSNPVSETSSFVSWYYGLSLDVQYGAKKQVHIHTLYKILSCFPNSETS